MGGDYSRAADKAAEKDADWRCGSYRYCNSHFYDTLRSWNGGDDLDMRHRTPKDWRVSTADTLGLGGTAFGHDLTLNDLEGWRRSSRIWVEKQFRGGMRDYPGQDVAFDETGAPRQQAKVVGDVSSGQGASIYRPKIQANTMSTARADECFLGSLRTDEVFDRDEYQRRRRRNLNLPQVRPPRRAPSQALDVRPLEVRSPPPILPSQHPQYKDLRPEVISKAKRLFAQIDLDGSGSVDSDELRKFLKALGHSEKKKALRSLTANVTLSLALT